MKRQCKGGLNGYKQQQIIRGIDLVKLLVIFAAQIPNVPPQTLQVLTSRNLPGNVIIGLVIAFVGRKRYFGVDDQVLVFGQHDDEIGAFGAAIFVGKTGLSPIVQILRQSGFLQQHFQLVFSPVSLSLVVTLQGAGQVVGVAAELGIEFAQLFDFFFQGNAVAGFFNETLFGHLFKITDVLPQRLKQGMDLFLILS